MLILAFYFDYEIPPSPGRQGQKMSAASARTNRGRRRRSFVKGVA